MKKFVYLGLLLILSCQDVKKAKKPDNLIPEDKMVEVLVDMHKLDALISVNRVAYDLRNVESHELIYQKHQIDSLQFEQSSDYYSEDFNTNERIFQQVKDRLEAEKKVVDSLQEIEQTKKQTIKEENREKEEDSTKKDLKGIGLLKKMSRPKN
ncbi:DUF4296 domain-containing protein [Mesonia sp. K7]|uniref:DUF4296 domain-containing protein n=1 Tax=Mesonia sp. K7 TaxID=2218606 RepID=UPI000DA8EFBD|nr:DUF4296 domain-containing protein [Mesonia sp. K7]PZD77737.1 hypothetical protein DNG35_07830 [Mesonia sp. K7]